MRPDAVHLTIVTDDPRRVCPMLFGFAHDRAGTEAPWCCFAFTFEHLDRLPDGAPVLAIWVKAGSAFESYYREIRHARGFFDDHSHHMGRIEAWLKRRAENERRLCHEALMAEVDGPPATVTSATVIADRANMAVSLQPAITRWYS